MKITIVGLGLMGGSLGLKLKSSGFATSILGVDCSQKNAETASRLKLVDDISDLKSAVSNSDGVILATPVQVIKQDLPKVLDLVKDSTFVTDFGSTKLEISAHLTGHPKRSQYVASHPMAGTENSGPEAAVSNLFDGRTAVICDKEQSSKAALASVEKLYGALGMKLIYMNSAEHDLHTAFISHLSHITSFVLANTVLDKERDTKRIFDLAGGGFESTVRLAKSNPSMWNPIFEQNLSNIVEGLESYISHMTQFKDALKAKDFSKTENLMKKANGIRRILESMVKS